MDTVTVCPKYQVVIPRAVRERARTRPGERLQVISFDDRLEPVPVRPMRTMRGFWKGFDARFVRDKEDRHFVGLPGVEFRTPRTKASRTRGKLRR